MTATTPTFDTWIHSDHYHCKKCGAVIDVALSLPRAPRNYCAGVRRIGICSCGQVLVETEHEELKWLKETF